MHEGAWPVSFSRFNHIHAREDGRVMVATTTQTRPRGPHSVKGTSTFPVVLERPLIGGFLYEDPVAAYAVGGVVSESPLHRHGGLLSDQRRGSRLRDVCWMRRTLLLS